MLESNAMRAFQWVSATRFGAIFFLGPVIFLLWRSLYMYEYMHVGSYRHTGTGTVGLLCIKTGYRELGSS